MRRKALILTVGVALLGVAVVLYRTRPANTFCIEDILTAYHERADYNDFSIDYPLDGTLFPPEIIAPTFRWNDGVSASKVWLVQVTFAEGETCLHFLSHRQEWTPQPQDWLKMKKLTVEQDAEVVILGVGSAKPPTIVSKARMTFRTSKDPVGAPLFYREVELPFLKAEKNLPGIRWRFGSIANPSPPVVLKGLPVCGNCHSFTRDGGTLAMDVDYAGRKGSYVITKIEKKMVLAPKDIITWTDEENAERTYGLLSQISPDGRYVVSTVRDMSIFIPQPSLAFSQQFFPIKGILCVYDRQTKRFRNLPGADDLRYVQTNPTWSPDGKFIVFARAVAPDLSNTKHQGSIWLTPSESKEFVDTDAPFLYDLYRIPFNDGEGGIAEPLEGASNNGKSNYFPRYSPDGLWIVFCRAKSFMLLQPDSELYIIPAGGGKERRLGCNTSRMNSWHSFSPNGKWLVFSSKAWSDYTQLCLTHIDDNGCSTPPVLLEHFTEPDRAANIPEFVNADPNAIAVIHERFMDR